MLEEHLESPEAGAMLVLSIFPGIDLLGRAFEELGFCVVRGPDPLWGGDIRSFHPPAGKFDGVIGGPPCKQDSAARRGHDPTAPDLDGEFVRVVLEARPTWWLHEAICMQPFGGSDSHIKAPGYSSQELVLDAAWFDCLQSRRRRFTFGNRGGKRLEVDAPTLVHPPLYPTIPATEWRDTGKDRRRPGRVLGRRLTFAEVCEAFGLPRDFDLPPFTMRAKYEVVGNGVPLQVGRALARAILSLY